MTTGLLSFDLKPGRTFEQAKQIAKYLNENLEVCTFTKAC